MHTMNNALDLSPLGGTVSELMTLIRRRQELERRFRCSRGEERRTLRRRLAHASELVRTYFR